MTALAATIQGYENGPATVGRPGPRPNGDESVDTTHRRLPTGKGPYRTKSGEAAYLERLAARYCPRPPCACGCGTPVIWRTNRGRWGRYAVGHYRRSGAYRDPKWLRRQYLDLNRSSGEIAAELGVFDSTILYWLRQHGIPVRNASESHVGRQAGERNPAWKGGVAKWDYAPEWKRIARSIRDRDEWTCQDCGEQRKRWGHHLHVHHLDGDKLNNDPANLVSLCAKCHHNAHRGR